MVLVFWVREQWRNSASFAQASPSRLGESCRNSFMVLVRAFHSGDEVWVWATRSLAQASEARLSEVAMRLVHVQRNFSSRREVLVLSDRYSRLGQSGSPKRGREVVWCNFFVESSFRRGLCVFGHRYDSLMQEELA